MSPTTHNDNDDGDDSYTNPNQHEFAPFMSGLATPPQMSSPAPHQPAEPAITDLLAALDESDDERDVAPSFYYQPNLEDSPEKPSSSSSNINNKRPASPLIAPTKSSLSNDSSPTLTEGIETQGMDYLTSSRASGPVPLSRSTSLVDPPARETRPFARVASVPASILRKDRISGASSPEEDPAPLRRTGSDEGVLSPEASTPAPSSTYARRILASASRGAFPSSTSRPREFPSTTPGLGTRITSMSTSSASGPRLLGLRRLGSNSPSSTPESEGTIKDTQEGSPESSTSPRISPSGTGFGSSTSGPARSRVMSGRLAAPPVRARKVAMAAVGAVAEESDEDVQDRERRDDAEQEARRQSLERRLELERFEEERLKEMEMEAEVERELQRERELREREELRERRSSPGDRNSRGRYSDHYDYVLDEGLAVDVSPTQKGHPPSTAANRARSASSSEHAIVPRAASSQVDVQRAVSSLDYYSTSRAVSAGKSTSLRRPTRPGQPNGSSLGATSSESSLDPYVTKSRGSREFEQSTAASSARNALRAPTSTLSRQGSAPTVSSGPSSAATSTVQAAATNRHRRNPTASDVPTMSNRLRTTASATDPYATTAENQAKENRASGTTWNASASAGPALQSAYDEGLKEVTNREPEERDKDEKGEKERTIAQRYPQASAVQQPPSHAPSFDGASTPAARKTNPTITVHRKVYQRLECIGKGGSSRVYKVVSPENAIYAIKRVSLENADPATIESYKNEIALLRRLEGNKRIIRLIEYDATSSKKNLLMVMECGEVDLAKLLTEKQGEPVDFPWVTSYWHQMLHAVQVIHEEKIVHSDLKPANFVLVKGSLKLIDFGIAKAIPNDTTNIQREQQIGTVNYMSPEAIQGTHGMAGGVRVMKLGRASDVWSLGCILYQMIYGQAPFYFLSMWQKMSAIPDPSHAIDFPAVAIPTVLGPRDPQTGQPGPPQRIMEHATPIPPGIIETMRSCLKRDPKARPSIPDLLAEKWNMSPEPPQPPRPSSPSPLLRPDEAIIDDNMMYQLIMYTLQNVPQNATPAQIKEMVKGLRPRLQEARRHRQPSSA
ncbi:Dual-specificity kinase, spindle pole body (SPB) duplication and spindle checkpoint function [Tulasnella sp. 424]|nr:Dual-specificity kinase, spindle pole body (SPB) duplication and spindle checkpoint function [Tulasnella sp. 424]